MSTMDGLAARFRRRARKGNTSQHAGANAAPGDVESHEQEASGVVPIVGPPPPRQAEADAVARAVLDALSWHDPL